MGKNSLTLVVLLFACRHEAHPVPTTTALRTDASTAAHRARANERSDLDALDARTPVPMLPMMANHQKQNMRDHLLAVQDILAGAASGDFAGVERAAARIGYSESMGRMCSHMGAAAPGFTERALEFHHTADTISQAAREHDQTKVLEALGATLARCTGCHAAFKQDVVDEATWKRLTARDDER
jgi:hypothetical protein